jgi:hypothetical protein
VPPWRSRCRSRDPVVKRHAKPRHDDYCESHLASNYNYTNTCLLLPHCGGRGGGGGIEKHVTTITNLFGRTVTLPGIVAVAFCSGCLALPLRRDGPVHEQEVQARKPGTRQRKSCNIWF